jgi:hypothetical protein
MLWRQVMVLYPINQTNKHQTNKQQGDWGDYNKAAQYVQVIQQKAARR